MWDVVTVYDDDVFVPSTVVTGSGVLHAVILRQTHDNATLKLKDGNGNELGFVDADAGPPTISSEHFFDVRYENGLIVYQDISSSSVDYTIFYDPD